MNVRTTKYGAAGVGALTLFATALSLGGGADISSVAGTSRAAGRGAALAAPDHPSTSTPGSLADLGTSLDRHHDRYWLRTHRIAVLPTMVTRGSSSEPSRPTGSSPTDPDSDSVSITIPHRVTVSMPGYESGRTPSVTPPSYEGGTAPSVVRDERRIVIDPGESGTWTAPGADPGKPGTFTPPQATVA